MRVSIRTRLLASLLTIAFAAAAGLSLYFLSELESFALRKLEERLYTEAEVLASVMSTRYGSPEEARDGLPGDARELGAALPELSDRFSTRVRVLDAKGIVLADSAGQGSLGSDWSSRREVVSALDGDYGAITRMTDIGRVALFVAVPVKVDGEVVGAAYTSSTTFSIVTLLSDYRERLVVLVLLFVGVTLAATELIARWLSKPLKALEAGAAAFAAGDHSVRVPPLGSRDTRAVAEAFNKLAEEVQTSVRELKAEEKRKSRFVSDVSHELRTPLTAIRGAAETLLEGDVPAEDAERFLVNIVSESDRLTRLANDLLTLQRIEGATGELPLSRVDLTAVVHRAVQALSPVLEERGVALSVSGTAPDVLGDRDRLQQVMANLVDNGSRLTPPGGTIEVTMGREDRWAYVRVRDEGPGIAEQDLERVFDRFYRAQPSRDRSSGGAGLGLAIVQAIITAHAGEITADSSPEGGAIFSVRLPALEPNAG